MVHFFLSSSHHFVICFRVRACSCRLFIGRYFTIYTVAFHVQERRGKRCPVCMGSLPGALRVYLCLEGCSKHLLSIIVYLLLSIGSSDITLVFLPIQIQESQGENIPVILWYHHIDRVALDKRESSRWFKHKIVDILYLKDKN